MILHTLSHREILNATRGLGRSAHHRLHHIRRRRLWQRLVAAVTLWVPAAAVLAQAPSGSPGVADIVARYGLRAVEPASPAADFKLPNLAGGETALSDFAGRWVILTFWATWCGPCRSEMPSMERLHRQKGESGVVILGVSIDSNRKPLGPFVEKYGLTFPNLWDSQGKAARLYNASSIPLSYLIDPRGRIVGISRGARDWTALTPMIDAMLAAIPPTEGAVGDTVFAQQDAPVDLPQVLHPPTADIVLSKKVLAPGESFFVDVRLQWSGNFEEYLPHPPELFLPEGISEERMTASTSSRDGRNRITYRVDLKAEKPGTFALDPVELRYTPRFESVPVASRLTGPTVEVLPSAFDRLSAGTLAATVGGLAALGLVAFWWIRRRGAAEVPAPADGRYEHLSRCYDKAKGFRLQGDGASFVTALGEIAVELSPGCSDTWSDLLERVRYGGQVPPAEELDRLQRGIERRLAQLKPESAKKARAALKLKADVPQPGAPKNL